MGTLVTLRVRWALQPPKLPTNLHGNPVWIAPDLRAFPVRFRLAAYFQPVGVWVGCWLDKQRNIDRCAFANYKGMILYEGDYTSCDDKPPVPDARLQLGNRRQSSLFVVLPDGTTLIPVSECEIRKRSESQANEWCPLCKEPFPNLKQQSSSPNSR
jgi:hypothetical protein